MTTRRNRRVIATAAIASIVAGLALGAFGAVTAPAGATPPTKVVICHATSAKTNPYQATEVNPNALDGGHDHTGHTGPVFDFANPAANTSWGDIIPPFGTFGGLNWGAEGQAVHGADCLPVELDACEFDPSLTVDDPGCVAPVELDACEFDPSLTVDDPGCVAPVELDACEFDPSLTVDDPGCVAPVELDACEFDPSLTVDDPGCVAPVELDACEFDPSLTVDDPGCVAPVELDACEFDPSLGADDPTCTPQVGSLGVTPPAAAPPSDDTGSPDGDVPSEDGSAAEQVVAPDTVTGGALPRTGGEQGSLVAAALVLITLGVGTLTAQRAIRPRRQGAHFAA